METFFNATIEFFIDNFPTWTDILLGGPPSLFWSYLCLYYPGCLKRARGCRTGYSRKIFHFLIFTSAVIIQLLWGISEVCLFGVSCTLVIFYAVWKGPGNLLYEAIAREKDDPHRTYYIVIPYFATLIGGLASNILFGTASIVGYLVTGLGDAIGEPVGTRFGKHVFSVPSRPSVKAVRSLEGSSAVFVISSLAILISILLHPGWQINSGSLMLIPILGLVSAGVEAVSPHGWDNATMQIIPTSLAWLLL